VRRTAIVVALALAGIAGVVALGGGAETVRGPREGTWELPRGGPYIFGFRSQAPARLVVDDVVVAEGAGVVTRRSVQPAGTHHFRFEAPENARLLWHPPGRRGSPEYVSTASLEGKTPWNDALSATAILLIVAFAFALLAEVGRPLPAAFLVFAVALVVRLALAAAGGQTWDEDEYWAAGRNYLLNLLDGDFSVAAWRWNEEHPPVTKLLAGVGALWTDGYLGAKLLFAIVGAGAAGLCAAIADRLFASRETTICAGLCAALLPHLVAHGAIVGHETPSLFFGALAIWLALRDRPGLIGRLVLAGAAIGLAVATRYLNVVLVPVVMMAALVREPRGRTALATAIVPAVAFAVVVGVSPLLWRDLFHTWDAAQEIAKRPPSPEWLLGVRIHHAPKWYFALYLVVTTPVVVLLAAAAGPILDRKERRAWLFLGLWLAATMALAMSPIRRDGIRYALGALFPLSLAAGRALGVLATRVRPALVAGGLAIYLAAQLAWSWPYPLDFYAEPIRAGQAQTRRWFEVGWWGEGITQAVEWVNRNAPPNANIGRYVVPTHVTWLRGDLWHDVADRPASDRDVLLVNDAWIDLTAPDFRPPEGFRLVHEERAQGASLVRVYAREGLAP
jgi:hypothetical protein